MKEFEAPEITLLSFGADVFMTDTSGYWPEELPR